ncbi:hypothetical protein H6P81_015892 [Aristolochia fimbriata]|uniref:Uncharacterized protein n=1 Tax=Aristolochia fimbriata TaxID=158543 RepID=A0AAV7EAK3_ARIFI|nr:hypothetical protein H6P81_015892 [Aristolochia fimbriata]
MKEFISFCAISQCSIPIPKKKQRKQKLNFIIRFLFEPRHFLWHFVLLDLGVVGLSFNQEVSLHGYHLFPSTSTPLRQTLSEAFRIFSPKLPFASPIF